MDSGDDDFALAPQEFEKKRKRGEREETEKENGKKEAGGAENEQSKLEREMARDLEIKMEIKKERELQEERQRQKEKQKQEKDKKKGEKEKEVKEKEVKETEVKEKEVKEKEKGEKEETEVNPNFRLKNKKETIPFPSDELVHSKATLIVCPVSLLRQWQTELQSKVRPGALRVLQYHGPKRNRDAVKMAKSYDVVLTSYSILTHDRTWNPHESGYGPIERIHWHRIVLDEAHYVKSQSSQTSRICRILSADIKWAVTGTPIQNSIHDIVGIMDFLQLEPFRTKTVFNSLQPPQVKRLLRKLVMRHTKEQQIEGKPLVALPPRQDKVVYSEFTDDERSLYKYLYSICAAKFNALAQKNSVASHYAYVMSGLVTPLRQMCAHTSLVCKERFVDDTGGGAKKEREGPQAPLLTDDVDLRPALEKLRRGDRTDITAILAKSGHPECPICLEVSDLPTVTPCFHLYCGGCIREIAQQGRGVCPLCRKPFSETDLMDVFEKNEEPIDMVTLDPKIEQLYNKLLTMESSKTQKIMQELKTIRSNDPTAKVVIFTQWTPFFKKIEEQLNKERIKFAKLTGEMSQVQKGNNLNKFQSDPSITVFLLSLRSGAVGLTLTAANHLFLLDPCFNKGTELQAVNRIYRIGQTRETTVHHIVAKGTIEEKIYNRNLTIHDAKEEDAMPIGKGKKDATKEKASIAELMMLFA